MEFRLDPDQVDLQETVARFFAARFPLDAMADREGVGIDRGAWSAMADLGVLGLLVAEEAGGSGLGLVEAALVFEQVGSHLVPGPVLWTVLAAPLIAGAATGEQVVTGVLAEASGNDGALVEHAGEADVVLIVHDDAVTAHRTADLDPPELLTPLDPLSSIGRFPSLDGGEVVGGVEAAERLRLAGAVLAAASLVGVASRALDTACAYALERQQFDVPIGSFQAIKHLLADMYVRMTLAQSATYAAAAVADEPGGDDPVRVVSAAKLLAAHAAVEGASTAVQVLGGMGFTWDMLPNYLLKRAWHLEHCFGSGDAHAQRLGAILVGASR